MYKREKPFYLPYLPTYFVSKKGMGEEDGSGELILMNNSIMWLVYLSIYLVVAGRRTVSRKGGREREGKEIGRRFGWSVG